MSRRSFPHIPYIYTLRPYFHCQACCSGLLTILRDQPEAVLRSYWARHWACAVDVLEMMTVTEAKRVSGVDRNDEVMTGAEATRAPEADRDKEKMFGAIKHMLVQLISEQYRPGGQYREVHDRHDLLVLHTRYFRSSVEPYGWKLPATFTDSVHFS